MGEGLTNFGLGENIGNVVHLCPLHVPYLGFQHDVDCSNLAQSANLGLHHPWCELMVERLDDKSRFHKTMIG